MKSGLPEPLIQTVSSHVIRHSLYDLVDSTNQWLRIPENIETCPFLPHVSCRLDIRKPITAMPGVSCSAPFSLFIEIPPNLLHIPP